MNYWKDFYLFGSKLLSSTIQAHAISLNLEEDREPEIYDEHLLIRGIYSNIDFPVEFRQKYGSKLKDVLDTGWPSLFLVSEKFRVSFEKDNVTGCSFFRIKIFDKSNNEIEGYHGLSIIGKCGPIDYSKCHITEKQLTPGGPVNRYLIGLPIDLDNWDGSDFFIPENSFGPIVSIKVVEVIKKNKLTNISLQNICNVETPEYSLRRE